MKNYTFKEWAGNRTLSESVISEGIDSEPQVGDFVITNPKAFMDAVIGKRGGLKNGGVANLRNFSRFKVNNVDGRRIQGDVHHRTYSGGHSKKFNSYDFLDVTPAFGNGSTGKVWLNNAPGRRATAHYINKMYPVWAAKMGIDGYADAEQKFAAQQAQAQRDADAAAQMQQQAQQQMQQQQQPQQMQQPQQQQQPQMQQPQMRPQMQQMQPQQMQQRPQQAAPWKKQQPQANYTMQNREVSPRSDHGDTASGHRSGAGTSFGFDQPNDNYSQSGVIPMGGSSVGGSDANFGMDQQSGMGGGEDFALAASHDPSIMNYSNVWKNPGDTKRYEYYPE